MDFMDFDRKKPERRMPLPERTKRIEQKSAAMKTLADLRHFVLGQPNGAFLNDLLV